LENLQSSWLNGENKNSTGAGGGVAQAVKAPAYLPTKCEALEFISHCRQKAKTNQKKKPSTNSFSNFKLEKIN
jgi:hypothetical protein